MLDDRGEQRADDQFRPADARGALPHVAHLSKGPGRMKELIEPRIPKGFRDFLPERETQRLAIIGKLQEVFRLFGFAPIDTPVLEFAEVLLGKGGGETDKEVYRFTDHGGRDVAMRFDLTVPFARFMAAHLAELPLPFRRWHAAKVWRGENTQRGRYREFMQVDFDVVGSDAASADLEILLLMRESMKALGMEKIAHPFRPPRRLQRLPRRAWSAGALHGRPARHRQADERSGRRRRWQLLAEIAGPENAARIIAFTRIGATSALTLESLRSALGRRGCRRPEHRPPLRRGEVPGRAGGRGLLRAGPLDHARSGLLHGDRVRDLPHRPSRHRLGLLGRTVQRPRLAVHEAEPAGGGRVDRHRPADGCHGGAGAAGKGAARPRRFSSSAWRRASWAATIGSPSPSGPPGLPRRCTRRKRSSRSSSPTRKRRASPSRWSAARTRRGAAWSA